MFSLRYLSCIIVVFVAQLKLAAQPVPPFSKISIASPTAAALAKYGDIPVGYHTGTPQVSIPLYTVQEGTLKLPISLSYHASGMKVEENASWVGSGWSLNAGGVITRAVKGQADDRGHLSNVTHGHFSNYGYNNYMFVEGPHGNGPPEEYDGTVPYDYGFGTSGLRDGEPDLFFFNFGNYSGKFYFRDDRTPVILPEEDFKIETFTATSADNITGFVITTPDGVRYYFGKNQLSDGNIDAIESTSPHTAYSGLMSATCTSSWYLNRIVSADSLFSIKLSYLAENYSYFTISKTSVNSGEPDFGTRKEYEIIKNNLAGVRLNQISFTNGTVTLLGGIVRTDLSEYDPYTINDAVNTQSKALGSIEINNNQGFCKKFNFQYSNFVDNTSSLPGNLGINPVTTDKKRLRLDTLREVSCDNTQSLPPYVFSYTTPSGDPNFAVRRLSFAQDHWGFYNGQSNNTLIPTYTVNTFTSFAGANREASWPEMSYGSLNKITYPTGGSTKFTFEANDTWLSYPAYNESFVTSSGIGPGIGQANNQTINITTTANPYKLTLDFHTNPSYNTPGSASFGGITVTKTDPHKEVIIQPGAGPHTYYLSMNNMQSSSSDWASCAILEEIPYQVEGDKPVGGLRIKKIEAVSTIAGDTMRTYYSYKQGDGKSSGILYSRPSYVLVYRNDIEKQVGFQAAAGAGCSPNGCLNCDAGLSYNVSGESIRELSTTQGNHIGYNYVQVTQTGNGHTNYAYYGSNFWDVDHSSVSIRNVNTMSCDVSIPNFPAAPLPYEFMRGELKYDAHYGENGTLLKQSLYYPVFVENPIGTPAYITQLQAPTLYVLKTSKRTKMTVVTKEMFNGSYIQNIDSSFFESPYHSQLTRKVSIDSKGNRNEVKYKYAFDLSLPVCDGISDCYSTYASAAATALSNFNYQLYYCTDGTWSCKWVAFQTYRKQMSDARIAWVNCRKTNFMNSNSTYKTTHNTYKANADAELKPVLELQDEYNNPVIETTSWKNDQLEGAAYNKYAFTGNFVYPVKTQALNLSALSSSFNAASNTNSSIIKDSRYADQANVKFANGVLVEITAKDGITDSYIWGANNTLPIIKATGIDYTTLNTAWINSGYSLTGIRSQPSLSTAFVSTYVYKPLVGIVTETNSNGRNLYYEYDKLGRLVLVRDHDNNIVKKICYNYAGQTDDCSSPCFNTTANWQNTAAAVRCQLNSGANTGYQEQEQRDMNVCSATYNQTHWIVIAYNTNSCPLPATCNNCDGEDKKCINGVCETGVLKTISTRRRKTFAEPDENGYMAIIWIYYCTTAYCFSDHTTSTPVETETTGLCTVDICQ